MELRLNTASLLKLAEEASFIRGDGAECGFEDIKNLRFGQVDGDVLQGFLFLNYGNLFSLQEWLLVHLLFPRGMRESYTLVLLVLVAVVVSWSTVTDRMTDLGLVFSERNLDSLVEIVARRHVCDELRVEVMQLTNNSFQVLA